MSLLEDLFGKPKRKRKTKVARKKRRPAAKKKPAVPAFAKLTITELNKKMAAIRKKRSNHKADGTLKAGPRKTIRQLGAYKGARRMKYKAPSGGRHK